MCFTKCLAICSHLSGMKLPAIGEWNESREATQHWRIESPPKKIHLQCRYKYILRRFHERQTECSSHKPIAFPVVSCQCREHRRILSPYRMDNEDEEKKKKNRWMRIHWTWPNCTPPPSKSSTERDNVKIGDRDCDDANRDNAESEWFRFRFWAWFWWFSACLIFKASLFCIPNSK